jgi:nucleotide-binding universal stress UspA family protein
MKPTILVPFDFSETAQRALAWAADLQRSTGAPPLRLIHAISARPVGTIEAPLETILPNESEIVGLEREMVEKARAHDAPATAAVRIRSSSVGDILVDAARDLGVELVVMGSHGRTGVKRMLLGSVAEHVLRHANCPVVTVRGPGRGLFVDVEGRGVIS